MTAAWQIRPVREGSAMVTVLCGPCAATGDESVVGLLEVSGGDPAYFHPSVGDHYRSAVAGLRVRCAGNHRIGLPGERLRARVHHQPPVSALVLPEAGPPRGEAARVWRRKADRRRRIRRRLRIG